MNNGCFHHIHSLLKAHTLIFCLACLPGGALSFADQTALDGIYALDPNFDASSPTAPEVTDTTLLENERFWPYHVMLTEPVEPGEYNQSLSEGLLGVLIRVEPDGEHVRVDFGRDGRATLPIAKTDVVARSNAVRTGEMEKDANNYVFMFAPRLVDGAADKLQPFRFPHQAGIRHFLLVFTEIESLDFGDLATDLRGFSDLPGLLTVLFPQTDLHDRDTRQILSDYGWGVPFLYGHLAEYYKPTLLPDAMEAPAVMLVSSEGRLLFAEKWGEGSQPRLKEVIRNL